MFFVYFWEYVEKIVPFATLLAGFATMAAAIASFKSIRQSVESFSSQLILAFLNEIGTERFIEIRDKLYNAVNIDDVDTKEKSYVINFFHKWGQMVKLGYLPLEVFNSSSGYAMLRLYTKLKKEIQKNCNTSENKQYADGFKWLYNEVKTNYFISFSDDEHFESDNV